MRSFGRQRFSLGLWVCAVYTLIICASLCIGISQSFLPAAVRRSVKALHVDVVAPWNASSLPLELLEGIRRIYSDRLFWSLLDQIADGTDLLRSANSDSERELSAIRWLRTRLELAWTAAAADLTSSVEADALTAAVRQAWRSLEVLVVQRVYAARLQLHERLETDDRDQLEPALNAVDSTWVLLVCGAERIPIADEAALASLGHHVDACRSRFPRNIDEVHRWNLASQRFLLPSDTVLGCVGGSAAAPHVPGDKRWTDQSGTEPLIAAILYTDVFRDDAFSAFHRAVRERAQNCELVYVIRMRRAAPSRAALTADFSSDATQMMSLSGYTVELALKSSDYVVLDTKQNETLWLQRNKTQHVKQRGAAGSVAIDIQDLDKDEIQATLDALLMQSLWSEATKHTGASETLEELLMDLTGSLLQGIEQLGNDLPSIGAALWKEAKAEPSFAASVAQSRALLTASAENLSRLHPELHWDNLPSVLFLNGRQVSPDASSVALCAATIAAAHLAAYRIWDMMDPLKTAAIDDRERFLANITHRQSEAEASTTIVDTRLYLPALLDCTEESDSDPVQSVEQLFIFRLNDIERDRKYQNWSPSFQELLQSPSAKAFPKLRRNAFRLVAFVNPGSAAGLEASAQLIQWVKNRDPVLPFQISLVLVPPHEAAYRWNASAGDTAGAPRSPWSRALGMLRSLGWRRGDLQSPGELPPRRSPLEPSTDAVICRAVYYLLHVRRSRRAAASFLSELHATVQREHPLAALWMLQGLGGRSSTIALPPVPPRADQVRRVFLQTAAGMQAASPNQTSSSFDAEHDYESLILHPHGKKRVLGALFGLRSGGAAAAAAAAKVHDSSQCAMLVHAEERTRQWLRSIGLPADTSALLALNGKRIGDLAKDPVDASTVFRYLNAEVQRLAELTRAGLAPDAACVDDVVYQTSSWRTSTTVTPGPYPSPRRKESATAAVLATRLVLVPAFETQLLSATSQLVSGSTALQQEHIEQGLQSIALLWDALFAQQQQHTQGDAVHLLNIPYRLAVVDAADAHDDGCQPPLTVWLLLDLDTTFGCRFLHDAMRVLAEQQWTQPSHHPGAAAWPSAVRLGLFHTGLQAGPVARSLMQLWTATPANASRSSMQLDDALRRRLERICGGVEVSPASTTPTLTGTPAPNWLRLLFSGGWGVDPGQLALVVNGRRYRIDRDEVWAHHAAALFKAVLQREAALMEARCGSYIIRQTKPLSGRCSPVDQSHQADAVLISTILADVLDGSCRPSGGSLLVQQSPSELPLDSLRRLRHLVPALRYRKAPAVPRQHTGSALRAEGLIAPFTAADASFTLVLRKLLGEALDAELDVTLNPRLQWRGDDGRLLQPRYVRSKLVTRFADALANGTSASVIFDRLAEHRIHSVHLRTPATWFTTVQHAELDPDNVALVQWAPPGTPSHRSIRYELSKLIVEGFVVDRQPSTRAPGLALRLEQHGGIRHPDHCSRERRSRVETIVMEGSGYFQLALTPGIWRLVPIPIPSAFGRQRDDLSIALVEAQRAPYAARLVDLQPIDASNATLLVVDDLWGQSTQSQPLLLLRVVHLQRTWYERVWALVAALRTSSQVQRRERLCLPPSASSSSSSSADKRPLIHLFSIASGHLYERLLRIMMLSAVRATPRYRCKFWLVGNFLSPRFRAQLPRLAHRLGFDYELVWYAWPRWLRPQHEKQRLIWAYKILFLDVLFPSDVERIIFIDSDQVVRGDLGELWELALGSRAVYGFVPFCDDRPEMDAYRFWKRGFWAKHLRGQPYHISALFVVDLKRFRAHRAGDTLRALYQRLSADPESLSNLDQDLPNYASVPLAEQSGTMNAAEPLVPLESLPSEWLWCETWCSEQSKARAKTIDLCNNPSTHESKLESARRIIPHWDELDTEATAAATLVDDHAWEAFVAQREQSMHPTRHDELR